MRPKDGANRGSDAKPGILGMEGSRGFRMLGGDTIVHKARYHLEYFAQVKDERPSRIYVGFGA